MLNLDTSILKTKTVLFVDDEPAICDAMERMLKSRFKEAWFALNGKEGFEKFKINQPDFVITDIEMPIMNGLLLLEKIKKIDPNKPVVIVTAFEDEAHKAIKADAIVIKPVNRKILFQELLRLANNIEDK